MDKQKYDRITVILAAITVILTAFTVVLDIPGTMYEIYDHSHPQTPITTPTITETPSSSQDTVQPIPTSTPTPTEISSTKGSISVISSPVGASIYLEDGTFEGKTPKILKDIEQGPHIIKLKLEGYEDKYQGVDVDPDKTISISPTLIPIQTPKPTETQNDNSYLLNTREVTTPTPVDISPYYDWSFTTAKDNLYVTVPDGYNFVSVTIKIHNNGTDPISTDSSYWKFVSDGIFYHSEPVTTAFYAPSQYEVKPGESLTFTINYIVKGVTTTGSLQYFKPPYYN